MCADAYRQEGAFGFINRWPHTGLLRSAWRPAARTLRELRNSIQSLLAQTRALGCGMDEVLRSVGNHGSSVDLGPMNGKLSDSKLVGVVNGVQVVVQEQQGERTAVGDDGRAMLLVLTRTVFGEGADHQDRCRRIGDPEHVEHHAAHMDCVHHVVLSVGLENFAVCQNRRQISAKVRSED